MTPTIKRLGIAIQIFAIGFGIWAGIQLVEWATGNQVSLGFR